MSIEINGFCDAEFQPLKEAFTTNFEEGIEVGASVAVTHQGESVVDLWGGYADRDKTRPWQEDTIVMVYSTTKVITILCILKLVSEGKIDLEAPIATYWPEFAQSGKDTVTTHQVLTHTSGLPGFSEIQEFNAIHDWDYVADLLARQEPWFEPGTQACYHVLTFGFLLGEIVRRVTGSSLREYFQTEFAQPAGADFHIGLEDRSLLDQVAELTFPDVAMPDMEGMAKRVFASVLEGNWQSWERQSAEIPAANGFGNARSIARLGAILAMNGELDGRRYISEEVVELATSEQSYRDCPPAGIVRFGLGLGLHSEEFAAPTESSFHWGGYGGSSMVMDRKTGVSFGYTPNNMYVQDLDDGFDISEDPRVDRLWDALSGVMAGL